MDMAKEQLTGVPNEARSLLALPGNTFDRSLCADVQGPVEGRSIIGRAGAPDGCRLDLRSECCSRQPVPISGWRCVVNRRIAPI